MTPISTRDWRDAEHNCHYYYNTIDGLIVGQVHNISHTKIWIAMAIAITEEKHLGRYISADSAQRAVERYWNIQDRTLLD
jgi:hypothetical protein